MKSIASLFLAMMLCGCMPCIPNSSNEPGCTAKNVGDIIVLAPVLGAYAAEESLTARGPEPSLNEIMSGSVGPWKSYPIEQVGMPEISGMNDSFFLLTHFIPRGTSLWTLDGGREVPDNIGPDFPIAIEDGKALFHVQTQGNPARTEIRDVLNGKSETISTGACKGNVALSADGNYVSCFYNDYQSGKLAAVTITNVATGNMVSYAPLDLPCIQPHAAGIGDNGKALISCDGVIYAANGKSWDDLIHTDFRITELSGTPNASSVWMQTNSMPASPTVIAVYKPGISIPVTPYPDASHYRLSSNGHYAALWNGRMVKVIRITPDLMEPVAEISFDKRHQITAVAFNNLDQMAVVNDERISIFPLNYETPPPVNP